MNPMLKNMITMIIPGEFMHSDIGNQTIGGE